LTDLALRINTDFLAIYDHPILRLSCVISFTDFPVIRIELVKRPKAASAGRFIPLGPHG